MLYLASIEHSSRLDIAAVIVCLRRWLSSIGDDSADTDTASIFTNARVYIDNAFGVHADGRVRVDATAVW
jgi:hypothetical protein